MLSWPTSVCKSTFIRIVFNILGIQIIDESELLTKFILSLTILEFNYDCFVLLHFGSFFGNSISILSKPVIFLSLYTFLQSMDA